MNQKKPVTLGWVGVRGWGRRFWDAVQESPLCRVGGCVHPDEAVAREAAQRMGGKAFTSLDALLDSDVDAVLLLVPNQFHFEMTKRCLEAGKHVLVEKPLTHTAEEGETLARLADARGLQLGVAHNYRRSGHIRAMKHALDAGRIGRPVAAEFHMGHGGAMKFTPAQWRYHRESCPGGPLNMLGTHLIDAAIYLFGAPSGVNGRAARLAAPTTAEDASVIRVDFEAGLSASIVNLYNSVSTEFVNIYGTEGALRFSRWPDNALWLQGRDVSLAAAPYERLAFNEVNTTREVFEEFVRAIRGEARFETPASVALQTVRVFEGALASSAQPEGALA